MPFPSQIGDIKSSYIGLTNQQLWNQFGVALGGELAPLNATPQPGIYGLVAPKA